MTEPMTRGAIARTTRDVYDLVTHGGTRNVMHRAGTQFEVEDYVPDGEVKGEPLAFYWGNNNGGMGNVCVPADAAEPVMTAEQAAARTIPTRTQLAKEIGPALVRDGGDRSGFGIFECDGADGVTTELFGKTDEGLSFGFRLRVEQVWKTDE